MILFNDDLPITSVMERTLILVCLLCDETVGGNNHLVRLMCCLARWCESVVRTQVA